MIVNTKILAINAKKGRWDKFKPLLEKSGYDLYVATDVEEALLYLQKSPVELVILDSHVPAVDYLDLIREIKAIKAVPVIIIDDSEDTSGEAIISLEVGASYYVGMPVKPRELVARINASLRLVHEVEERVLEEESNDSAEADTSALLHFGNWILDRDKMRVMNKDQSQINLTAGEYQILEALVLSPGKLLSRQKLFELTRDEEFEAYDRAIDIQIARIRKKLKEDSKNPKFIKTVRGAGYMLEAEVKEAG